MIRASLEILSRAVDSFPPLQSYCRHIDTYPRLFILTWHTDAVIVIVSTVTLTFVFSDTVRVVHTGLSSRAAHA